MIRILFLVPNPLNSIPGQRFRFEQYLWFLQREGVVYKVCPFISKRLQKIIYKKGHILEKVLYTIVGFFYRIINLFQSFRFDIVYIYREAVPFGPPIFEKILRLIGKKILFDFDDAIYLPYANNVNRFVSNFRYPKKADIISKNSKIVIVGNRYLQEHALKYNPDTIVLPTVIDTDKYLYKETGARNKVCVGWSGSHTTILHLSTLNDVLRKLYLKYNIRINVIGFKDFRIDGIKVEAKEWSIDTELNDLREFDIGIMPLPDDEWARGKCGLKALQYMALGIPAVCSPVGVNTEIIEDGKNGFLCRPEEEWFEKLSLLIEDYDLRERLGAVGRKTVEERYSVRVNAPKYLSIIRKTYGD